MLCTTLSPRLTVPFEIRTDLSGMYLLQTLFLADDPPTHYHPGYLLHVEEQPSPSTLLPSSHSDSYLIPSPQT